MNKEIKIVMADDHPIVRQGLRQIIEQDRSIVIMAEAGNGREALAEIARHQPDIAVLDIDMPEMDGFDVVRALLGEKTKIGIVLLTMHSEDEIFDEAMNLGVGGYVLKDSAVTDIVASIKAVALGRHFLSPALSSLLIGRRQKSAELRENLPGLTSLTPAENRILKLISEDKTSREIAAELFISQRTVETHRTNICRKLDLRGNLALVRFAVSNRAKL